MTAARARPNVRSGITKANGEAAMAMTEAAGLAGYLMVAGATA